MFTDDQENQFLSAFLSLPCLLDSVSAYSRKIKEKNCRPSKQDIKDGFIFHIPRASEAAARYEEKVERMFWLGFTLQPHIPISGETLLLLLLLFQMCDMITRSFYLLHPSIYLQYQCWLPGWDRNWNEQWERHFKTLIFCEVYTLYTFKLKIA